jgi:hypothetical protein
VTRLALLAALAVAIAAPAASAGRYSFGRQAGNIEPYTVTISTTGAVTTIGPVKVGRRKLSERQLGSLAKTVVAAGFSTLPATTFCLGTLPDFASTWVEAGTQKVSVRGSCSPRFTRVWSALASAVRLSAG